MSKYISKKPQNVNTSQQHVEAVNMTNQNNELDRAIKLMERAVTLRSPALREVEMTRAKQAIQALYAPKPVTIKDIASPNMTPEASKVVSDAIERSAEAMNKKPVENGELRDKAHKTLDVYLDGGGPYEFVIVNKDDYERTIEARLAERAKLKEVK